MVLVLFQILLLPFSLGVILFLVFLNLLYDDKISAGILKTALLIHQIDLLIIVLTCANDLDLIRIEGN